MRWFFITLFLITACKKKPPVVADTPAPVAAPAAAESATVDDPAAAAAAAAPRPAGDMTIGFGPSKSDLNTAMESVLPKIEKCVDTYKVKTLTGLRFRISPKGEIDAAQVVGNPAADDCVTQVLATLHFAPWNGEPQLVGLPITAEGKLLRERPPGVD
jgi:hypothetical protein